MGLFQEQWPRLVSQSYINYYNQGTCTDSTQRIVCCSHLSTGCDQTSYATERNYVRMLSLQEHFSRTSYNLLQ